MLNDVPSCRLTYPASISAFGWDLVRLIHLPQSNLEAARKMTSIAVLALANICAKDIKDAFSRYNSSFGIITRRAGTRFANRDWSGKHADALERLDLYETAVMSTVVELESKLSQYKHNSELWALIRAKYANLIQEFSDQELFKTFFNSITRRFFATLGVNAEIEFIDHDPKWLANQQSIASHQEVLGHGLNTATISKMLKTIPISAKFRDLDKSVDVIMDYLQDQRPKWLQHAFSIDRLDAVLYRNTRAYAVYRLRSGRIDHAMTVALVNNSGGVEIEAVIFSPELLSVLFGSTRTYFHIDVDCVLQAILFLNSLLPDKPTPELYAALGRIKQGKTELFREFTAHLGKSIDPIVDAAFDKGMVMVVFTLESYPLVFKVIRDRFAPPKSVTHAQVMEKYDLVFKHDRAGRLIDAHQFKHLRIPVNRFAEPVLEELLSEAGNRVTQHGDDLLFSHVYVERKLTPLNVFLRAGEQQKIEDVIDDYAQSIRDLAYSNIFPGDLLLKNFGVSRHGRVIFYDYDEICLLTECKFRKIPPPQSHEEELFAEPWFEVGPQDIFPEQFRQFLGLRKAHMDYFVSKHSDILTVEFWRAAQQRIIEGKLFDPVPYKPLPGAVNEGVL